MLEKLKIIFGFIWLLLLITQTFFVNRSLQFFILLSFCAMLFVMGLSEYKKDPDAFLPFWYFIFSSITLLIATLTLFNII